MSAEPVGRAPGPDEASTAGHPLRAATAGRGGGLLGNELRTLFRRRRTQAMLAGLAAIPVLIAVAVRVSSHGPRGGAGPLFLDRVSHNGMFVSVTALTVSIPLFLPLTISVVAGDTIAGEAGLGTLRYLLLAPAGRVRLLAVKLASTAVFCLAATIVVVAAGFAIGAALFPVGPVTLLSGDTVSVGVAVLRTLLVAGYVTLSLLGLSALGLFVSTLTEVPVGAMAATAVLAVASQILDSLPQLDWLHPWLFSHQWLGFADLLRQPILWSSLQANLVLQGGYLLVFAALAYARFGSADVLA